ncbi:hypothetical protein BU26DRAFT_332278 [Trematosphaeria pertusa]|uniref:Uncharacterized protein n=1 Tax=Trematosphaeria pertusa TaxID=390896 RepID=A0A6A6ID72_9PLEO|nr:uncharacterized protein BU26DRAFT_332278 [Trematosphaeria pertusa]KAF2248376.1 hypothetical protein BU26DRAFT_332278 [Trematosphaeria pertusa]
MAIPASKKRLTSPIAGLCAVAWNSMPRRHCDFLSCRFSAVAMTGIALTVAYRVHIGLRNFSHPLAGIKDFEFRK